MSTDHLFSFRPSGTSVQSSGDVPFSLSMGHRLDCTALECIIQNYAYFVVVQAGAYVALTPPCVCHIFTDILRLSVFLVRHPRRHTHENDIRKMVPIKSNLSHHFCFHFKPIDTCHHLPECDRIVWRRCRFRFNAKAHRKSSPQSRLFTFVESNSEG